MNKKNTFLKKLPAVVLFALLMSPATIHAAHYEDSDIATMRQVITIQNLINALELNSKQTATVLKAAKTTQYQVDAMKRKISANERHIKSTYSKVLDQSQDGHLVMPKELTRDVHQLHKKQDVYLQDMKKTVSDQIDAVKNILEPHQLVMLEEYKPCIIPHVENGRIGQAGGSHQLVKKLERLHGMKDQECF
jgi:hypothetical protein